MTPTTTLGVSQGWKRIRCVNRSRFLSLDPKTFVAAGGNHHHYHHYHYYWNLYRKNLESASAITIIFF